MNMTFQLSGWFLQTATILAGETKIATYTRGISIFKPARINYQDKVWKIYERGFIKTGFEVVDQTSNQVIGYSTKTFFPKYHNHELFLMSERFLLTKGDQYGTYHWLNNSNQQIVTFNAESLFAATFNFQFQKPNEIIVETELDEQVIILLCYGIHVMFNEKTLLSS